MVPGRAGLFGHAAEFVNNGVVGANAGAKGLNVVCGRRRHLVAGVIGGNTDLGQLVVVARGRHTRLLLLQVIDTFLVDGNPNRIVKLLNKCTEVFIVPGRGRRRRCEGHNDGY